MSKQKHSVTVAAETMSRHGFDRALVEGIRVACGSHVKVLGSSGVYTQLRKECFREIPKLLYGKAYIKAIKLKLDMGYNVVEAMSSEAEHIEEVASVTFYNALEKKFYKRGPINTTWGNKQVSLMDREGDFIVFQI